MFTTRFATVAAVLALGVALAAPAAATTYPQGADYRGQFVGTVTYVGFTDEATPYCVNEAGDHVAPRTDVALGGTWRANVGQQIVSARIVMLENGEPHVVYTAPFQREASDATFQASLDFGQVGVLTLKLVGEHFTYTIEGYDVRGVFPGGVHCERAIFNGTLS